MQVFTAQRWQAFLLLIVGLAWLWFSRSPAAANSTAITTAPHKGFLAPDFTLETTQGEAMTLAQLHGKPAIVNFWASWCPPCRAEMPTLQRLYEQRGAEFVLLGVNASSQDSLPKVYQLLAEQGITFPILLDVRGETVKAYQVLSLPTTFFIDRQGLIREVVVGGPLTETGLHTRLDALLGETP